MSNENQDTKPMTATKAIADITKIRERRENALRKTAASYDGKEDAILAALPSEDRVRVKAFFAPIGGA